MANNWYCNNCNSGEESWVEHQDYKPTETYRRDMSCYACDKWELISFFLVRSFY